MQRSRKRQQSLRNRYSNRSRKIYDTHFWIAPVGVTHVSVVAVGGGGTSGGGGGLGWKNNIEVVPGDTYTIVVGAGGDAGAMNNGLDSYFISVEIVKGGGKKKKERRNVFIKNFFFFY